MSIQAARVRRHERIERTVVREIAYVIRSLALCESRLLQIQAQQGLQALLFRDQLVRPERPVIYDQKDVRGPEARAETSMSEVDFEAAEFPAPNGHFHLVVAEPQPCHGEERPVDLPGGMPGPATREASWWLLSLIWPPSITACCSWPAVSRRRCTSAMEIMCGAFQAADDQIPGTRPGIPYRTSYWRGSRTNHRRCPATPTSRSESHDRVGSPEARCGHPGPPPVSA